MRHLSSVEMVYSEGAGIKQILAGVCGVITVGDAVYAYGVLLEGWNPIGWVSGVLWGASMACGTWGAYEAIDYLMS